MTDTAREPWEIAAQIKSVLAAAATEAMHKELEWVKERVKEADANGHRRGLEDAAKAMLTAKQLEGLADWMLKRCDLDNNAPVLTMQVLWQKAEAVRALAKGEGDG